MLLVPINPPQMALLRLQIHIIKPIVRKINLFLYNFFPRLFLNMRSANCNRLNLSLRPSVRLSVCISNMLSPKPLDGIQRNLVC